ncbi:pmvk [Bugula neritina]|uniref:Phosphomevalonate kinase n=1 Tax=Bugula neritina TaxID=10212 RepID=A0A7J7J7L2_BUGNE|nr:pmvk [Bugula neritina]
MIMVMANPRVILVFSGKRKSGKDYVTDMLQELLGDSVSHIMKLSAPLKKQYAIEHNLDFERLLDTTEYKEKVRVDMIAWGERKRDEDSAYFCRLSTETSPGFHKPVWIISDARRKTDIKYFKETYPSATMTVRVTADIATRENRGYVFTRNVDDAASECDLDGESFDLVIDNNGDSAKLAATLQSLKQSISSKLTV